MLLYHRPRFMDNTLVCTSTAHCCCAGVVCAESSYHIQLLLPSADVVVVRCRSPPRYRHKREHLRDQLYCCTVLAMTQTLESLYIRAHAHREAQ
jgi:hypothetical protein